MKNITALFILISSVTFSQTNFNKLSLELSSGYSGVIKPYLTRYKSGFSGFKNINIGGRYMFTEKIGVRIEYVNDRFINDEDIKAGTYFNRYGIQGIYNLGKDLDIPYLTNEKIGLLTHAGIGYTTSKPKRADFTEQIGSIIIGITPEFKINNKIALFTDVSSVINMKQHYRYDGSLFSDDYKATTGYHFNVSFGIMIYLGEEKYHNDWY